MIQLPQRSVTRFFIPLIDVLILLFCIYLLLPIVETPAESAATDQARDPIELLTASERAELERLRQQKAIALQNRLSVRVLEIDGDNGKLFYYDPDRAEIKNEAEARDLISRQKRTADGREIYYLFLYPRTLTGYPEERQMKRYNRWFADVPHGFDNPRAAR
jgi:hypothetical protein